MDFSTIRNDFNSNGFTSVSEIYSDSEIDEIISIVDTANTSNDTFRKLNDLFAIRQFLKEIPESAQIIFNSNLKQVIRQLFGEGFFVVKSIYFDKPHTSNWYVSYHQDLTISVNKRIEMEGYSSWTVKQGQFAVKPPLEILQNIFTIRIHLDDTDENNGALKVIPKSHLNGVYHPETIDWAKDTEEVCNVPKGGVMLMKPLLLHSSSRTTNNKKRRVIHIEFSKDRLPGELQWAEKAYIN
ncbi:phytanoyl-CoA dioxygenase [Chitinophagaceae bacterium IBVUCB2]|nr:phytanoyl-CoA dioxygenase [Chitinophagaceae bacterium IBVUCB2]